MQLRVSILLAWTAVGLGFGSNCLGSPTRAATAPATSQPATMPAEPDSAGSKPLLWAGSEEGLAGLEDRGSSVLWQMLGWILLILVIGAIGCVLAKKLMPRISASSGRRISILETTYLGPRKAVHLLQVGNRRYIVSSSREDIRMLADVTDAVCMEEHAGAESG